MAGMGQRCHCLLPAPYTFTWETERGPMRYTPDFYVTHAQACQPFHRGQTGFPTIEGTHPVQTRQLCGAVSGMANRVASRRKATVHAPMSSPTGGTGTFTASALTILSKRISWISCPATKSLSPWVNCSAVLTLRACGPEPLAVAGRAEYRSEPAAEPALTDPAGDL